MVRSQKAMSAARVVAADDLKRGQYVVILQQTYEFAVRSMVDESVSIARVTGLPCWTRPPLKVVSVFLPLVLIRDPEGNHEVLDVREYTLGLVDRRQARVACKVIRCQEEAKARQRKKRERKAKSGK